MLCTMGILVSCGRRTDISTNHALSSSESRGGPRLAIKSMTDLRQLLPLGLMTNAIFTRLGLPDRTEEAQEGRVDWTYSLLPFPAENMRPETYVIGVTLTITNGYLAWWGCAYASPHGATIAHEQVHPNGSNRPSLPNNQDRPLLEFFIISTNPIAGGRLIDTEPFPKLGFISSKANLEISNLKGVTFEERTIPSSRSSVQTVWTLTFHLSETDASRFESLTADNIDKSFLMMVADEPLFSASIREPIPGGNFRFESTNQAVIEAVKKQLINVPRENQ